MNNNNEMIQVAKIGRLVGLKGELKLNIHCDFPEQFRPDAVFATNKNFKLTIDTFNRTNNTISFKGYASREDSVKLVNLNLFTTKEATLQECDLRDGEFFWFDIIGAILEDDGEILGEIQDINRIGTDDYLIIKTADKLIEKNLPKLFYLPYIDRYIINFDKDKKIVYAKDAIGILENS